MKFLNIFLYTIVLTLLLSSCDKNESAPEIVDQEFTIVENSPANTLIGIVEAFDPDEDQVVSFEIVDGNADGVFKISSLTGILSVNDPSELDYEKNTQFLLTVSSFDSHKREPLESTASIKIHVRDINEFTPEMKSSTYDLKENPGSGQIIGAIQATDKDSHQGLYYSFPILEDSGYVSIDSASGTLTVSDTSAFDFESRQQIILKVLVSDDHIDSKQTVGTVTINIQDVAELSDGLLAYFPFDGNSNDQSGNNVSTELIGPVLTADRFGNPGSAYLFDGIDDFMKLNNNNAIIFSRSFSISIWAKMNGKSQAPMSASNALFEQRHDMEGGIPVFIQITAEQNGEAKFLMRSNEDVEYITIRTPAMEYGSWHHYAATVDTQKNMSLYIDGELKATGVFINDGHFYNMVNRVSLGALHPSGIQTGAFNGVLDEAYIHNRALSESEIEKLFLSKFQ